MHVADPSLCKELYELSGWRDTPEHHWQEQGSIETFDYDRTLLCPAYSLSYLLRRLPKYLVDSYQLILTPYNIATTAWSARYMQFKTTANKKVDLYESKGHNPEDALCKLAIELFKQGILERSSDDKS